MSKRCWQLLRALAATWIAGAVGTVGALALTSPAGAAGNGKFSIEPYSLSPNSRPYFTPVLTPGVPAKDRVVVVNETKRPLTLDLYASQAINTKSGGFALEPNFKPKVDMGAWIHLPYSVITVPPLSGDIVPFTYDVPDGVPPGDYSGGIVAEETSGTVTKAGAVRIQALLAVGTAVYGRVPGPLHPALAVTKVRMSTTNPLASEFGGGVDATVTYTVTNTGNENVTPEATVSVSPLVGVGPSAHVALPQLLPGSTVEFTHTFGDVAPFGSLTGEVSVQALGVRSSGSAGVFVVPWGLVAVVVLVVLFLIVIFWRRRRRRAATAGEPDGAPAGSELVGSDAGGPT